MKNQERNLIMCTKRPILKYKDNDRIEFLFTDCIESNCEHGGREIVVSFRVQLRFIILFLTIVKWLLLLTFDAIQFGEFGFNFTETLAFSLGREFGQEDHCERGDGGEKDEDIRSDHTLNDWKTKTDDECSSPVEST